MSSKRVYFVLLVASLVMLAAGVGPRNAGTARALPSTQKATPSDVTVPYPGYLATETGQPVAEGTYDLAFSLYATETSGESLWSEVQEGVPVQAGEFVVSLGGENPIPAATLAGGARWLAVAVRGPGETDFTALSPRQRLGTAEPAAQDSPSNSPACPHDHFGELWYGSGDAGLTVSSDHYLASLEGLNRGTGIGVAGIHAPQGWVLWDDTEVGVYGWSDTGHGVYGSTDGDWSYHSGVYGRARNDHANGVTGWNSAAGAGEYGFSTDGFGLYAVGKDEGNFAQYRKGDLMLAGSYGDLFAPGWLRLYSDSSVSVHLDLNDDYSDGFYIYNGAGQHVLLVDESGDLWIAGTLHEGTSSLQTDASMHPEEPYSTHSSVAGPDTRNVYDGVVVLDRDGTAWVELPAQVEELRADHRYQLTPIGAPAPALHIAQEIEGNRFRIAGGEPGLKVSWQVTGIQRDANAVAQSHTVEKVTPGEEQGQPVAGRLEYTRDTPAEEHETGGE